MAPRELDLQVLVGAAAVVKAVVGKVEVVRAGAAKVE